MSLKSVWQKKALARYIVSKREMLRRLRVAADEFASVDHIMVAETSNERSSTGVTKWGGDAPLCSPAIDEKLVRAVHPYVISSPRLCSACERKITNTMLPLGIRR